MCRPGKKTWFITIFKERTFYTYPVIFKKLRFKQVGFKCTDSTKESRYTYNKQKHELHK
jgi:hypothetical protein